MMNFIAKPSLSPVDPQEAELCPRVVAAPGMLDREVAVIREEGEPDARYQSRSELFALLIERAKEG